MTEAIAGEIEVQALPRPEKVIELAGRSIMFRGLTEGQHMQMVREASLFRNDSTPSQRRVKSLERLYIVMLSLVKEPDDREYVEDMISEGELDITFLVEALRNIYEKQEQAQQKVRRGRPAKRQ